MLDRRGAELLLGKGRLAAKLNEGQSLVFAQSPFHEDISLVVQTIRMDNV